MPEPILDPELNSLEKSLRSLEPQGQIARDVIFYRAGQAAGRWSWLWPTSTALSALIAVCLGALLWSRTGSEPQRIVEYVIVEKPVAQPVESPIHAPAPILPEPRILADSGAAEYLKRRKEIIRFGAEMLPHAPPQATTYDPLTPGSAPRLSPEGLDIIKLLKPSSILSGDDT